MARDKKQADSVEIIMPSTLVQLDPRAKVCFVLIAVLSFHLILVLSCLLTQRQQQLARAPPAPAPTSASSGPPLRRSTSGPSLLLHDTVKPPELVALERRLYDDIKTWRNAMASRM